VLKPKQRRNITNFIIISLILGRHTRNYTIHISEMDVTKYGDRSSIEFEILKLIVLRERYLKKLHRSLSQKRTKGSRIVDLSIIGQIDVLRDTTIEVVESIFVWERFQVQDHIHHVRPFLWNREDYLSKIFDDTKFLDEYSEIVDWLGFLPSSNPFYIPNDVFNTKLILTSKSYLIFGKRPDLDSLIKPNTESHKKMIKSPYVTPIVNDPDVIPSLSSTYKMKKQIKESNLEKDHIKNMLNLRDKILKDPYEAYISAPVVEKIRHFYAVLVQRFPHRKQEDDDSQDDSALAEDNQSATIARLTFEPDAGNEYLRMKRLQITDDHDYDNTDAHIWTPHDLYLQRAVQKRGGELSIITAASTKSRIKPPTRKTKYERLDLEIAHTLQNIEIISMQVEDYIASSNNHAQVPEEDVIGDRSLMIKSLSDILYKSKLHHEQLQREYRSYRAISHQGIVTDLKKRQLMKNLYDGQVLDIDERKSTELEQLMAHRIQRLVRRKLGRTSRSLLLVQYHNAAIKIQTVWRRIYSARALSRQTHQVNIAVLIQKLFRRRRAKLILRRLQMEARSLQAVICIQRIYRGFEGRRRFGLRREFLQNIKEVAKIVSSVELLPQYVDALADELEAFIADPSLVISTNVLSVLRAVLYTINGDDLAEQVLIYQGGNLRSKSIFASRLSWKSAVFVLRRKGRLLRRIRALVKSISIPNPVALRFSKNCIDHLLSIDAIIVSSLDSQNDSLYHLKSSYAVECIQRLSLYCRYMIRIQQLQQYFPDYFKFSHENWFRTMLSYQHTIKKLGLELNSENVCLRELETKRHNCLFNGKKLGPVLTALKKIKENIRLTSSKLNAAEKKLQKYVEDLEESERSKLFVYQNVEKTKQLSLEIAKRELDEFHASTAIDDESKVRYANKLKALQSKVDRNFMSLIECQAEIQALEVDHKRKRELRQMNRLMIFKRIDRLSGEYGVLLSDLLVMQDIWNNFVSEIGGAQYGNDLVGDKQLYFANMKISINQMMELRAYYLKEIQDKLDDEFKRFDVFVLEAKSQILEEHWDQPTVIEYQAEERENYAQARVDANQLFLSSNHQFISNESSLILPSSDAKMYQPVILVLDATLPKQTIDILIRKLSMLNFQAVDDPFDANIVHKLRAICSAHQNAVIIVDKGIDNNSFKGFVNIFRNIIISLPMKVRIVNVNHQSRFEPWHSQHAVDMSSLFIQSPLTPETKSCLALLGRLRHFALLFRQLLMMSSSIDDDNDLSNAFNLPSSLKDSFKSDWGHVLREVETLVGQDSKKLQALSTSTARLFNQVVTSSDLSTTTELKDHPTATMIASLTSLLNLWTSPNSLWSSRHLILGINALLSQHIDQFCDLLNFQSPPECSQQFANRLQQIKFNQAIWQRYLDADFNNYPARSLLAHWCLVAIELIKSISNLGGFVSSSSWQEFKRLVDESYDVSWQDDICSSDVDVMVGRIFQLCFASSVIHDKNSSSVTITYNKHTYSNQQYRISAEVSSSKRLRLYQYGQMTYVGIFDQTKAKQRESAMVIAAFSTKDFANIALPTSAELALGRVLSYDHLIAESSRLEQDKWIDVVSSWIRIDEWTSKRAIKVVRNRSLLQSCVGIRNGYHIRIEIFEERFNQYLCIIYGLRDYNLAVEYTLSKADCAKISEISDEKEEKIRLDSLDSFGMVLPLSDRISIKPSKPWQDFFQSSADLMHGHNQASDIKIYPRLTKGAGRLIGSRVCKLHGLSLIITLYELTSEGEIFGLRILIHDIKSSKSVEYRLAPVERMLLFEPSIDLITQVISRIRLSYCNIHDSSRIMMQIVDSQFSPPLLKSLDVYGDCEYAIILRKELASGHQNEDAFDTNRLLDRDDDDDEKEERAQVEKNIIDVLKGSSAHEIESIISSQKEDSSQANAGRSITKYQWNIFFDRSLDTDLIGNLSISICVNVILHGIVISVYDRYNRNEIYKFLSYETISRALFEWTVNSLESLVMNLSENLLMNLVDELFDNIVLQEMDSDFEEGLTRYQLILKAKDGLDDILIAELCNAAGHQSTSTTIIRHQLLTRIVRIKFFDVQGIIIPQENDNEVDGISILSRETVVKIARQLECIVYYDGEEIGKIFSRPEKPTIFQTSSIMKDSTILQAITNRHRLFKYSQVEFAIYENTFIDNNLPTRRLLGNVNIQGKDLEALFSKGSIINYPINMVDSDELSRLDHILHAMPTIRIQGNFHLNNQIAPEFANIDYNVAPSDESLAHSSTTGMKSILSNQINKLMKGKGRSAASAAMNAAAKYRQLNIPSYIDINQEPYSNKLSPIISPLSCDLLSEEGSLRIKNDQQLLMEKFSAVEQSAVPIQPTVEDMEAPPKVFRFDTQQVVEQQFEDKPVEQTASSMVMVQTYDNNASVVTASPSSSKLIDSYRYLQTHLSNRLSISGKSGQEKVLSPSYSPSNILAKSQSLLRRFSSKRLDQPTMLNLSPSIHDSNIISISQNNSPMAHPRQQNLLRHDSCIIAEDLSEEVPAVEIQEEKLHKRLDIYIMKGFHFPSVNNYVNSTIFLVKLDDYEVARSSRLFKVIDDSGDADFGNEYLSIPLDLRQISSAMTSISDHVLDIEIWNCSATAELHMLLGTIEIAGDKLAAFASGAGFSSSWFTVKFNPEMFRSADRVTGPSQEEHEDDHLVDKVNQNAPVKRGDSFIKYGIRRLTSSMDKPIINKGVSGFSIGRGISFIPPLPFMQSLTEQSASGMRFSSFLGRSKHTQIEPLDGNPRLSRMQTSFSHNNPLHPADVARQNSFVTTNPSSPKQINPPTSKPRTPSSSKRLIPFSISHGSFKSLSSQSSRSRMRRLNTLSNNKVENPAKNVPQIAHIELQGILCDQVVPPIMREIDVHSIVLRNLSYYDHEGREVASVNGAVTIEILFNKRSIKTIKSKTAVDRTWMFTDKLKLELYGKRKLSQCVLSFRIYEGDTMKLPQHRREELYPIGVKDITGNDLVKLLSAPDTSQQKKPVSKLIRATLQANGNKGIGSSFELHSPETELKDPRITTSFHGLLELQGKLIKPEAVIPELIPTIDELASSPKVVVQMKQAAVPGLLLAPQRVFPSLVRELLNQRPEIIYVKLLSMKATNNSEASLALSR
jgi:hypothetical protein